MTPPVRRDRAWCLGVGISEATQFHAANGDGARMWHIGDNQQCGDCGSFVMDISEYYAQKSGNIPKIDTAGQNYITSGVMQLKFWFAGA